jgi:2-iminobutanoate/2-iminopropanoate deaminase
LVIDHCFLTPPNFGGVFDAPNSSRLKAAKGENMPREIFASPDAPAAIGPYSQGVKSIHGLIFLSGQTPIDPTTGELVAGGITEQTQQVFKNIAAVLEAAGKTFDDVVKCNVYLIDMADFAGMNAVYGAIFAPPFPARTTVAARELPKKCLVEIECIAQ